MLCGRAFPGPFRVADFEPLFRDGLPHGVVVGVSMPDGPGPVDEAVLASLHPAEAAHARTLGGYRQVSFVGGRLALREARWQVGAPLDAVLPDARGTPQLPAGWTGSVTHKRTLAVAMVARAHDGTLGVDVEDLAPARDGIADRVLRPAELDDVRGLPAALQWNATVLRFSLKESIYKALDPYVRRFVGFQEAEVWPDLDGTAQVTLHLAQGEGPFRVDARYQWLAGRVLTSVRIAPAPPSADVATPTSDGA